MSEAFRQLGGVGLRTRRRQPRTTLHLQRPDTSSAAMQDHFDCAASIIAKVTVIA